MVTPGSPAQTNPLPKCADEATVRKVYETLRIAGKGGPGVPAAGKICIPVPGDGSEGILIHEPARDIFIFSDGNQIVSTRDSAAHDLGENLPPLTCLDPATVERARAILRRSKGRAPAGEEIGFLKRQRYVAVPIGDEVLQPKLDGDPPPRNTRQPRIGDEVLQPILNGDPPHRDMHPPRIGGEILQPDIEGPAHPPPSNKAIGNEVLNPYENQNRPPKIGERKKL